MIFPPEIWEHIFLHIDPVTLINSKAVCKSWHEIIDNILKENDYYWRKVCKQEIPEHLWSSLWEKLNPYKVHTDSCENTDSATLTAIYRLWRSCENWIKSDTFIECIEPLPKHRISEHITCVTISGQLMAIGTSEGYIYFYSNERFLYVADHMERLRSINLYGDGSKTFAVSCSTDNHIKFWDLEQRALIDKMRGKYVSASYSCCYTTMNNEVTVRQFNDRSKFVTNLGNVIAVSADDNKVLFYTDEDFYVKLSWNINNEKNSLFTTLFERHISDGTDIRIRRCFIFKQELVLCITDLGYLGVLTLENKWRIHNVLSVLHATPTTVLVYGHLLILGLDSGTVHIFHVEDFEAMDLTSTVSKEIILDSTSVVSLDIIVLNKQEYLIVASSKKIYRIKFI